MVPNFGLRCYLLAFYGYYNRNILLTALQASFARHLCYYDRQEM